MQRSDKYDAYPLPIRHIYHDRDFNCRTFTVESVSGLAESIRTDGLDTPVTVQPAADVPGGLPPGFAWRLLAGHRRFMAAKVHLKWVEIAAVIRKGLTPTEASMLNFRENLERKDLNPVEEALNIKRIFPADAKVRTIGAALKKDVHWVHNRLCILKLPEEVQAMLASGRLYMTRMEIILREPEDRRVAMAERLIAAQAAAGGKKKRTEFTGSRSFKYKKSKAEINGLIAYMMDRGVPTLTLRALAWSAGAITDEQIRDDILAWEQENPKSN